MSSRIGNRFPVMVFGESHGPAIGMVMDTPPVGLRLDKEEILRQLARRAPGNDPTATARKESDLPEFLSGLKGGVTTGAPLAALIRNQNQHSKDYEAIAHTPRPSHADYAASVHYHGFNDPSGGGHFSGRLTAPLVIAGTILRQYLQEKGVEIGAHIYQIGRVTEDLFDPVSISPDTLRDLSKQTFPLLNSTKEADMRAEVETAKMQQDSVGGAIEVAVTGLPAGLGSPMFDGVENAISKAIFGIPAIKGIAFGDGFSLAGMRGSQANDPLTVTDGKIRCKTNHSGGITGGITNGMPLIFRVAVKPTPSIGQEQDTIDLTTGQPTKLTIHGRHDPCIVPRAVPAVEAVTSIVIANLLAEVL